MSLVNLELPCGSLRLVGRVDRVVLLLVNLALEALNVLRETFVLRLPVDEVPRDA